MEASLLSTKLFIPPLRPGIVSRPRLLEKIQAALNYPLTLISAPAGFGKTTLLSEWIHYGQSRIPSAWLSLEETENDPVRFWDYLIAALQTVQPKTGEIALSLLHSPQPLPIEAVLTALINDLAKVSEDFILVLDDYHFINSEPVHKGINFLLEHLPPKMHLIIGTRVDPPFPLVHFRGQGKLLEIGTEDLRFNLEEASALLNTMNNPELSAENVEILNTRSEGWIAGLKMAMLSMQNEKDIPGFISRFTGSQRYIMDYLLEEVLNRQSQEVQDFLLKTSVLQRLSGSLCDAVTQSQNGSEMLLTLERDNLFVIPLDASREWYRYHHLFGELLYHKLEIKYGKDGVSRLHQIASQWYENQKLPEDAIYHALAARDWERVLRIVSVPEVNVRYQTTQTMLNWLRQIPDEILYANLEVCHNYMWALLVAQRIDDAKIVISRLEPKAPETPLWQGRIAAFRTSIAALQGDTAHIEEYAQQALSLLSTREPGTRAAVLISLGAYYTMINRYTEAEPLLQEALAIWQSAGMPSGVMVALSYLGVVIMMKGQLELAEKTFQEAIAMAEHAIHNANAHLHLGWIHYLRNELEAAVAHQERVIELQKFSGMPFEAIHVCLACSRLARGENEKAELALAEADCRISENKAASHEIARIAACHVFFASIKHDADSEARWLDILAANEKHFNPEPPWSSRRRLYAREGRAAAILHFQDECEDFLRTGQLLKVPAVRLCQALLAESDEEALNFLSEALSEGRVMGDIRDFVDEGLALAPLLRKAIALKIEPEYARKLLDIIEMEANTRRFQKKAAVSLQTSSLLSEREIEVLRLVAEGISNELIAGQLSVSLATIKTHVHHIIEKLGVRDRSQAVFKAKELKLL
jgi:LuxR family transcriptional regulator, maltose regulon positive regulatory protein